MSVFRCCRLVFEYRSCHMLVSTVFHYKTVRYKHSIDKLHYTIVYHQNHKFVIAQENKALPPNKRPILVPIFHYRILALFVYRSCHMLVSRVIHYKTVLYNYPIDKLYCRFVFLYYRKLLVFLVNTTLHPNKLQKLTIHH
jgi:hypothetical protein